MIFAAGFGLGLGTIAGLSLGPFIFGRMQPKPYGHQLGEEGDKDRLVEAPETGTPVTEEMRSLIEFTEPWTCWPDYERVAMINRILAVMWPTLTKAIMDMVLKQVPPQLEKQVFDKYKFIEDIVLGTLSMRDQKNWDKWIHDKHFTIGTVPPRIGGIKCYNTADDEVILEVPLVWGSNAVLDVGVFLRGGPARLYVPLQIANLQFKVETRITIKPLVEDIPCVGGATVTLLKAPHVDLSIKLIKGVDLLALPIIKDVIKFGIQYVLNGMVIYPNSMSFPIMPNFGVAPSPKGALNVKLLRGENLKHGEDTFVKLEVRKGRVISSKTVLNTSSPQYNEEFNLVVDDFQTQSLQLTVFNDTLGWNDTPVSVGTLNFGETLPAPATAPEDQEEEFVLADFVRNPMLEQLVSVPLLKYISDEEAGLLLSGVAAGFKSVGRLGSMAGSLLRSKSNANSVAAAAAEATSSYGTLYLKVMFMPFIQPTFDDEDEAEKKKAKQPKKLVPPTSRVVSHNIQNHVKGVLTVHLIRCINLVGESPNSWVRMLASDEDKDQEFRSNVVFAENSPRWGTKYDFVMINAGATLHFTVYSKHQSAAGTILQTVNIFGKKKKETDHDAVLGKFQISVKDIATNGFLKDTWTLEDTERGQIELALTWQTCEVPDT